MIDKDVLEKAIELELENIGTDMERRPWEKGEIIYVPIRVEVHEDKQTIGCLDHSNIMGIYNELMRAKNRKRGV